VPVEVSEIPGEEPLKLRETEYAALRQTIATRGTVRMILLPISLFGWAGSRLVVMLYSGVPVAALMPLAVLTGVYEPIQALGAGVGAARPVSPGVL
jgi:hypothetical protein